MNYLASFGLQILVMVALAPLVNGIIKKVKAFSQKRKGPPLLQLYYDLWKLFKKDTVVSETTSWIFRITPYIVAGAVVLAALLVPVNLNLPSFHFAGDVILVIYLLGMARFFMVLSGLDSGSTFGGMGSSREVMISVLLEPSLLISMFTIGLIAGSTSVYSMMISSAGTGFLLFQPVYLLLFLAVFIILIAETSRIPVDDPATHLELTMVHEAMILEYSGKHLALMEWAACIKQLIFITLLANIFLPLESFLAFASPNSTLMSSLLLYLAKVIFIAVLVAVTEISTVKLRLFSVPNLAALSFILAFLGFFQYLLVGR